MANNVNVTQVISFLLEQGCNYARPFYERALTDKQCELRMKYSNEKEKAVFVQTSENENMLVVFSEESFKFAFLTLDEKLNGELNDELTFQWRVHLSK